MSSTENSYSETDLGNVSPNPRGEYDPETSYEYLDLVNYEGGSYLCLAELGTTVTGVAPAHGKNTETWQLLTLPGDLTPEYIAMHDDVVNKAEQVEASRAAVEQSQQEIEAAQTDVQQLHSDTVEAAQEASDSRDSAAGYAQAAETSRQAAAESEQNVNAQITGFDTHVSESVTQAQEEIAATRQQAIRAVASQQVTSTQAVKDQTASYITEKETSAKIEIGNYTSEKVAEINNKASKANITLANTIADGTSLKTQLETTISTADTSKKNLDASDTAAGKTKTALDISNTTATKTKADLDASNTTASEAKTELDATNKTAADLVVSLRDKITEGTRVKTDIQTTGETAMSNLQAEATKQQEYIKTSIDDTLSISGKAADAAVTGKKMDSLKEDIKDLSESVNGIELSKNLLDNSSVMENKRPSNWAGQTINDSYKTDGYYTFRAIPVTQNSTYYFVENGDLVNSGQLATYDKDGKYISLLSPSVFNVNGVKVGYIIPENVAYVRGESKTSNFSNVNFKLFNGRFEKKFLKYNESAYDGKNLPVIVFDFDQVVEIDARFTILKKYGFAGNVVETATNNYEITKELVKMGYDISPYLGNHTWDYSTEDGIQKLAANIAEKLGGLEAVGIYNPTMISCSGHKYSDTMEKILSSYKIDYVRCSGFIKDGVQLKKSMYENSYGTRIVVPISLGSYNGVDEFNATIDSLVDGNVPLIMPFMHTFGYDADWITQEAFEKVVSHVSDLVKNDKALCMNMHDFVAYNDAVKSIHDDYIRNMSAIFN